MLCPSSDRELDGKTEAVIDTCTDRDDPDDNSHQEGRLGSEKNTHGLDRKPCSTCFGQKCVSFLFVCSFVRLFVCLFVCCR